MTALRRILDKFKKDSTNTVEQGAKFEKLTKFLKILKKQRTLQAICSYT